MSLFSNSSEWGPLSSCSVQASHCGGFSRLRAQALGRVGFSSCGTRARELRFPGSRSGVQQLQQLGGRSCPTACGLFPDQGPNLRLLHWRAASLPLSHQESPLSGTSLVVQWLRLCAPSAGSLSSPPGQGTINRSCMPQLRPSTAK